MPQDYHIYIHSEIQEAGNNKTTPSYNMGESKTAPSQQIEDESGYFGGESFIKNFAIVTGSIAVVNHVISSVNSYAMPFVNSLTGDVNAQTELNLMSSTLNLIAHPISSAFNYFQWSVERNRNDIRRQQRQLLTGNGIINNYGGKGS